MIFVCCYSYREFGFWCDENGWNRHDQRIRYLSDEHSLRGILNPIVLFWGQWYKRNDIDLIKEIIAVMTRPVSNNSERPASAQLPKGEK